MKLTSRWSAIALFTLASAAASLRAQPVQAPPGPLGEAQSKVEAAVSTSMSKQRISGLSVAVATDGQFRWSHGYGFADLENSVPFTASTVWRLGSISKPLTAVAAMQLAESGRLELDVPIQRYCPAFPEKGKPITTRHLLGHLSGIRHYAPGENFNSTRHYEGVTAALDAFKNDPLLHDPGTYTYSTYGYVVLGCVVEGASSHKFADEVREKVTAPAGMEQTRPDDVEAIVPRRARGYQKNPSGEFRNAALADTSNKVPGGGFVSTSPDLIRFALALQQGRILKPETFRQMQVPMKTTDGKESPYFGWTIADRKGDKVLSHSGSQQGTSTYLLMVPAKGFAVAIIANTQSVNVGELASQIAEILLP
ncbi:MAG TPA: serine hydrolase domain-containing protein [Thermoanaerobaculia bacterium]|nr:serine hydrolase domain-containing protein [Thermoanaerobaculia bacterium]